MVTEVQLWMLCQIIWLLRKYQFFAGTAFAPTNSSGWDWGDLRNINYFLQYNNDPKVPVETRKNYNGIAKFFRAYFYFEKVKRFGDVPWIGKPLDVSDTTILYGPRDSRTLVMDSVLADIDYACANITSTSDATRSLVTKYVAYALKSRICLFEGTFRKYHTELGLTASANTWLDQAAAAAKSVMDDGGYSIYTTGGTDKIIQIFIHKCNTNCCRSYACCSHGPYTE